MNYTKGEWKVGERQGAKISIYITERDETHGEDIDYELAQVSQRDNEQKANANLIAAAPDMYEYLKELHSALDAGYERIGAGREGRLNTILAKAEGK